MPLAKLSSAQDTEWVITMSADGLAPVSARSSAGNEYAEYKVRFIYWNFIPYQGFIINFVYKMMPFEMTDKTWLF